MYMLRSIVDLVLILTVNGLIILIGLDYVEIVGYRVDGVLIIDSFEESLRGEFIEGEVE